MNKFVIRLLVACTCFALSVALTSFANRLRGKTERTVVLIELAHHDFNADETQLRNLYREYGPAQTRRDRAFFEELETEDFVLYWGGNRLSREEDIQLMERSSPHLVFDRQVDYIKTFGLSAVVHGRMTGRYGYEDHVATWYFIDTWVKRDQKWKIQSTTSVQ
jgi:hypothetical protein